ncbi:hypothetical protein [Azospirillum doebereinerae]
MPRLSSRLRCADRKRRRGAERAGTGGHSGGQRWPRQWPRSAPPSWPSGGLAGEAGRPFSVAGNHRKRRKMTTLQSTLRGRERSWGITVPVTRQTVALGMCPTPVRTMNSFS